VLGFRHGELWFREVDGEGRTVASSAVTGGANGASETALAESGGRMLGAWVSPDQDRIQAAFLGKHSLKPFTLNLAGGIVEHPSTVVLSARRFGVLFEWQRHQNRSHATYDIYLASISYGAKTQPRLVRLIRSARYGLLPRGVMDGSGALDTMYLEQTASGAWAIDFERFRLSGTPLGVPVPLGSVSYQIRRPDTTIGPAGVPPQWGMDLQRAGNGSMWGVCRAGATVQSPRGDESQNTTTIYLTHWSASGRLLLAPTVVEVDPGYATDVQSLAMAVTPVSEGIYFTYPGDTNIVQLARSGNLVPETQSYGSRDHVLVNLRLNPSGQLISYERVAYDGGAR